MSKIQNDLTDKINQFFTAKTTKKQFTLPKIEMPSITKPFSKTPKSSTFEDIQKIANGAVNFMSDSTNNAIQLLNIETLKSTANSTIAKISDSGPKIIKNMPQLIKQSIQNNPVSYAASALLAAATVGYYLGQKTSNADKNKSKKPPIS
jgi:hypothetical protein